MDLDYLRWLVEATLSGAIPAIPTGFRRTIRKARASKLTGIVGGLARARKRLIRTHASQSPPLPPR